MTTTALALALALVNLAATRAGQCRTAQITFRVRADPAAGRLEVERAPDPYGRGILCTRFEVQPDSAPVRLRFTRGLDSCDPASPRFNESLQPAGPVERSGSLMVEHIAAGAAGAKTDKPMMYSSPASASRRLQNPDFPPGCGGGSGARVLPDDAFGGARECQESCMWCSASLWQNFAVHLEPLEPYAAAYCLPIRCAGEAAAAAALSTKRGRPIIDQSRKWS
eukprot:SAG31_NODE_1748_length_7363_cov_288.231553_3_plen_223_part_00